MTMIEDDNKTEATASDTANTDPASGTPTIDTASGSVDVPPPPAEDDPLSNERLDAMDNLGTAEGKYK